MGKRKYEKVKGYWVYSIKIPSINKYYIGVSKLKCCNRWKKIHYKTTVLKEYLQDWQDMEKKVLIDGLTKEQAYKYEDNILRALSINNLCINERRSGLITNDINTYQKQRYEDNTEYYKQYYENNKNQINQRHKQWQKDNKEKYNEYRRQWRLKKKLEQQHTVVD